MLWIYIDSFRMVQLISPITLDLPALARESESIPQCDYFSLASWSNKKMFHVFLDMQIQNHTYSTPSLSYKVPSVTGCHASLSTNYMYVTLNYKLYSLLY